MKILCLITDAFGGHGGISKFNRDLLTALCAHPDVEEVVAVPRIMPHPEGNLPAKLKYEKEGVKSKFKFVILVLRILFQRSYNFDLIICGHINLIPLSWLCRKIKGAPLALIIHGIDAWQPTRSLVTNFFVKKIDMLISVSEYTRKRFLDWAEPHDVKVFILPNSVDLSLFSPAPKSQVLSERYGLNGKIVLLTLGRLDSLERAKGFDEVMDVLPQLANEFPNILYLIAGAGRDKNRLEQKVKSLGIEDLVVFTGFVAEAEKTDHYRVADVYVMPSRGEGFGIVLLEAMACGVPTIASKVDGSREALRDGLLGILVDPDNPTELIAGIREALRMPRQIPDGLEHFSDKSFQLRVHQFLDTLTGSSR
ncbi:MAG: glycosyltransferase family 4 protein [Chlorobium sp.]|nr:glycosyltransferase family 4 protein [Chlorobium sp.]